MESRPFSIVLFTDSFPPLEDATSLLNKEIVDCFGDFYQVTVFAPLPLSELNSSSFFCTDKNGVIYRRLPLPFASTRRPFLKLIKFFFLFFYSALYVIIKNNARSLYLIHSSPPVLIPLFAVLVSLRNVFSRRMRRLVLIVHDLYPDIAIGRRSVSSLVNLCRHLFSHLFRISYNSFDLIITCSPAISVRLKNVYDVPSRNIEYIPNWSLHERGLRATVPNPSTLSSHPLFVIGNFGYVHLPDDSADFLLMMSEASDIRIECFIKGACVNSFYSKFSNSLDSVSFNSWISPSDLNSVYAKHWPITFVSLDLLSCSCAFPSRIITALCWGSPILFFTDNAEGNYVADFISFHDIGIVCTPFTSKSEFSSAYADVFNNYSIYSERCFRLYSAQFDRRISLCRYLDCIDKLF